MTYENVMLHITPWFLGVIVAFCVYIVKGINDLNKWRVRVDTQFESIPGRVNQLERWQTEIDTRDEPDKELRQRLPGISSRLDTHAREIQEIRTEQIKERERTSIKLDMLLSKFDDMSSNCLVHKLMQHGSPETLTKLLREGQKSVEEDM